MFVHFFVLSLSFTPVFLLSIPLSMAIGGQIVFTNTLSIQ
jgi:hypothetical protein